ncbi:MAG: hypothetical protein KIS90_07140 [Phenylobacterium sp.]|nr:hypothetical protein [Phenylobacterium sp.]
MLSSEITTVQGGRLYYQRPRRHPAGRGRDAGRRWRGCCARRPRRGAQAHQPTEAAPGRQHARACGAGAARAAADPADHAAAPWRWPWRAATRTGRLTDAVAADVGSGPIQPPTALAWGQGPGGPSAVSVRRILVLVADHPG